ncbi:MAG: hypothetical protein CMIDDMOC_00323 [Sodalis sp. Fle]|nr:MAG: hypothetical protein CMIDDMOC_00323 [Sodalis sp. Fle]
MTPANYHAIQTSIESRWHDTDRQHTMETDVSLTGVGH